MGMLIGCAAIVGVASPAAAQGFGVRSGASVNPDQFSVGGQYDLATRRDRVWMQPSADLGFGNDTFLTALNFDLVYRRPIRRAPVWTAFAGGGPALNHYRFTGNSTTEAGANLLGGLMHRSGFFTELRLGFFDSPEVRFGAGYRLRGARGSSSPTAPRPPAPRR
jgi:hypothetical protein